MSNDTPTTEQATTTDASDSLLMGILNEIKGLRLDAAGFRALVESVADSQIKIASMLENHGVRISAIEKTIESLPCKPNLKKEFDCLIKD